MLSAREFVGWYNGHPDFVQLPVDLSKARLAGLLSDSEEYDSHLLLQVYKVAILGQGNVALDCARVLLQARMPGVHATICSLLCWAPCTS